METEAKRVEFHYKCWRNPDDLGNHCFNNLFEISNTEENEERSMIEPRSFEEPKLKELIAVLIEWINDELADQRIIVKDIEEDLYDGQVLQKLLGKLSAKNIV